MIIIFIRAVTPTVSNLPFLRATPGERDGWADEAQASKVQNVAGRDGEGGGKLERKKKRLETWGLNVFENGSEIVAARTSIDG